MSQLSTFWTEPPTHIRVYPCPQCKETISVDAPTCRFCHVPVDVQTAEHLWAENQHIVTAVRRANTFSVTSRVALLVTALALWILSVEGSLVEVLFISPLLAISYGAQWLTHNRSLAKDDDDYLAAVTKVKRAMLVWGVALFVQIACYLMLNGALYLFTILEGGELIAEKLRTCAEIGPQLSAL